MTIKRDDLENKLVIRREFKHPAKVVFDAWTNPDRIKQWLFPGPETGITLETVEIDLRISGRYKFGYRDTDGTLQVVSGEFNEIVPSSKLSFTWVWEPPQEEAGVLTLVTVEFFETKEKTTELVLTHEKLKDKQSMEKHEWGWCGALSTLEDLLAVG